MRIWLLRYSEKHSSFCWAGQKVASWTFGGKSRIREYETCLTEVQVCDAPQAAEPRSLSPMMFNFKSL